MDLVFRTSMLKQQLLYWLDDSSFLHPKDMILKAMEIACSSNIRRLNYVVGILRNWQNDSVLTLEEVDTYDENKEMMSGVRNQLWE